MLATLLPALEERGELPATVLGTSIGALNASHVAAYAHTSAKTLTDELIKLWHDAQFSDIIGPLISPREFGRLVRYVGGTMGIPRWSAPALLDTTPMPGLLRRLIDFDQLYRNIDDDLISLAVVATSYATGNSFVFQDGHPGVARHTDLSRGIDYVPTRIDESHVQASASIPVAFPATRVELPADASGWYGDGGTRLNTPIKPALKLGAKRVIVIGLNSAAPPLRPERGEPDLFDGAAQFMQALFADPLAQDVETLAGENVQALARSSNGSPAGGPGLVPYIFVAPRDRLTVGELAAETFRKHLSGFRAFRRAHDLVTLGTIVGAGRDAARGELFSLLFFATEFHDALIDLGQKDAARWLAATHDDGPWHFGPPPPPPPQSPSKPKPRRPRRTKAGSAA